MATAVGLAAVSVAAGSLGIGYYVAHALTAPKRPSPTDDYVFTPFEMGASFESVTIPTDGGNHSIDGWWLSRPETNRVIIGCTGYRASKSDLLGIGAALWRAGFNVLLFDYHGHGAGRGVPVTLAYREVHDFFAALGYAERRLPEARIGVIGFSMGAAIAIWGSAQRPQVRAVVADSPFATHADVLSHAIAHTIHVPGEPFAHIADYFIKQRAGYHHADVEPLRYVAQIAPRPLLIIHGTADEMIPVEHAHRLYTAAVEPKELWIGVGAAHCGTYFLDRQGYCQRVAAFFERALGDAGEASVPVAMPAPVASVAGEGYRDMVDA
ncbi:MAG: alpha/beta hydrolase [Ktedonobacterales bacterium]